MIIPTMTDQDRRDLAAVTHATPSRVRAGGKRRVVARVRLETLLPVAAHGAAGLARVPRRAQRVGNLERAAAPAARLARGS